MKIVKLLCVVIVLSPALAFSEEAPVSLSERSNVIFATPALVLGASPEAVGGVGVAYGRVLSPNIAFTLGLQVNGSVSYFNSTGGGYLSASYHNGSLQVQLRPGVRFFLTEKAPSGFWVGPRLEGGYSLLRSAYPGVSFMRTGTVGASGLVGYSHVFASAFFLEAAAGVSVEYGVVHNSFPSDGFSPPRSEDDGSVGISGLFEVGVGYAF